MAGHFDWGTIEELRTKAIRTLLETQREFALTMDNSCHEKAVRRNQQTFTLVEQDRSSPKVIAFWILENIETCSPEKLVDALLDAIAMRDSPTPKKNAD